jgi:hypothetical protein
VLPELAFQFPEAVALDQEGIPVDIKESLNCKPLWTQILCQSFIKVDACVATFDIGQQRSPCALRFVIARSAND